MDLTPLIASFTLFSLMEFGDKTHIAVITLSMKHKPFLVFAGALGAFAVVDGASVLVGGVHRRPDTVLLDQLDLRRVVHIVRDFNPAGRG